MELFGDDSGQEKIEQLYRVARSHGREWVQFLDLCFDGGDSIEEADGLLNQALADSPRAEAYFEADVI